MSFSPQLLAGSDLAVLLCGVPSVKNRLAETGTAFSPYQSVPLSLLPTCMPAKFYSVFCLISLPGLLGTVLPVAW